MSRQDDDNRDNDRRDAQAKSRSSAEIEQDIAAIRSRMDRTLDEIEYRLSPGQMSASIRDTFRDVVEGNPENRLAMAIRNNPLPVALIGVGVIWLGIAVLRESGVRMPGLRGDPARAAATLGPLVALAREGAALLRTAEGAIDDPALRPVLVEFADEQDRSAVVLEGELRRLDPAAVVPDSGGHADPAWDELRRALGTRERAFMIRGAERGAAATLEAYREAMHQDLPEETRVVLGARFHEAEQMCNRLGALRQAA
jgi:hypothetical protein